MTVPIQPELSPAEVARRAEEARRQRQGVPQTQVPVPMSPATRLREAHDLAQSTPLADSSRSARILRLQGQTAFPTDFVDRNLDALERQVAEPSFDAEAFWKDSPAVAEWLAQDPARVGASGPDLMRMGRVERYLRAIGSEFQRNRLTTQLTDPTLAVMFGQGTAEDEAAIAELSARRESLPRLGPEGFVAGIPVATIGQLPILFDLYKGSLGGGVVGAGAGAGAAAIAGQLGPQVAIPEELATVPVAAARGFYLGTRAGVAVAGMKLSMAEAFLEYRNLEGITREEAAIGAMIAGSVAGALEVIPFGSMASRIPGLRRFGREGVREMLAAPSTRALLRQAAGHLVTQGLAEGSTEGFQALIQHVGAVLTQRVGDGSIGQVPVEQLITELFGDAEAWREIVSEARAGAQAGTGFSAAASTVTTPTEWATARRAERNADLMRQAAESIHGNDREEAIGLSKDAPQAMRDAVASIGADGAYYDVSAWSAYWQEQKSGDTPLDPREVAVALGVSPEEYDAAVEGQTVIRVPTDRLLVDGLGSVNHRDWLTDNLRTTPNEMSKAEAEQVRERLMAEEEQAVETGEAPTREVEVESAVEGLEERLTTQLRGARVPAGDVTQVVTLWREALRTVVERNPDIPVAEIARRFEQVNVVATPVAVTADGKPVSLYEVTGQTVQREDGVQVPLLRSTQSARSAMARQDQRLAQRYGGDVSKMSERERTAYESARQTVEEAEAVNRQLTPFPTIEELRAGGALQQAAPVRPEEVDRMQAATAHDLATDGLSERDIADEVGVRVERVRQWLSRPKPDISREDILRAAFLPLAGERRALANLYANADVLEQAAFHGSPHVFDENLITITHRNGEPVTAAERTEFLAQSNTPTTQQIERLQAQMETRRLDAEANPERADELRAQNAADEREVRRLLMAAARGDVMMQGDSEPRGAFIAPENRVDGPRLIALFKERNQSTFLHESAHAFLDLWTQIANDPNASPEFKAQVQGLRSELGAEGSDVLSVKQEEAFAGMFLDYLMSGKAPSQTLRVAFASFAKWLTKLWSILKGEIVPANPKVRDLLNRMLATDEAIAEAEGQLMEPLFPDDMAVNAAAVAARVEAEEKTRTEAMVTIVRAEQAWWKAEAKRVSEEVRATVEQDPAYVMRQGWTQFENPDGSPLPADSPYRQKLNRAELVALIGEDATKRLPRGKAGAVYSTEGGGLSLPFAAQLAGFDSASAMIETLQATKPMDEHIATVVDGVMRARYGDPMTEGTIPEVAIETLHNANLDRMRQLEIEAILRDHPEAFRDAIRKAAARPKNVRELKAWAESRIAGRPLNTLRPQSYLAAERRHQTEAIKAASEAKWDRVVLAKTLQRAASALYAETMAVREDVSKAQKLFAKVLGDDEAIAKRRNFDIVETARAILAHVGVGQKKEQTSAYLKQLAAYDPQTAQDLTPLVEDTLAQVPTRQKLRDLTVGEFHAIHEVVAELWKQSREAETVVIEGKRVALADAMAPMVERMDGAKARMDGAGIDRRMEWTDKANKGWLTSQAFLRRIESWVDLMDAGDINGPFRRGLFTNVRDGTAKAVEGRRIFYERYEALLKEVRPTLGDTEIAARELGSGQWVWEDTAHLLGAMLHTGNPSNFSRLLAGRGWTMDQWVTMRSRLVANGTLRPEHFRFVQAIWDMFEEMKPDAQRVHRQLFGRYFAELTREPFTITFPDGHSETYDGGYTPASKDPDASGAAARREAESFLEEAYGMRFPTVLRKFALNRVNNTEPLALTLNLVTKHIDAVQRFVHLASPVRDVGRMLRNREFRDAFDRVDPTLINEMLLPWLERAATQRVEKPFHPWADAMGKYLRETAGAAFMFLNVRNALEQVTGLTLASLRVESRYLGLANVAMVQEPATVEALIRQHSPYMRELVTTKLVEVQRRVDHIATQPTAWQTSRDFVREHAYVLQSTYQDFINRTVWYGSYLESVSKDMTIPEAVRKADADVRLTQGSFEAVDVSRIETGTPLWRAVAMFAGWFNMVGNLNATEAQKTIDAVGLKKSMPRLFYVYTMGFAIPMLFSGLLRQASRGFVDWDGDDDWGYLDDFLAFFFGEQFRSATAMFPGAGQVVNSVVNAFDNQPFNDRISLSPALSFVESATRGVKAQYDILSGDDLGRRDIRDVLSFYSLMTRVPVTGFAPPLTYLHDVETGRARPTGPLDFTRGLVSGQPGRR